MVGGRPNGRGVLDRVEGERRERGRKGEGGGGIWNRGVRVHRVRNLSFCRGPGGQPHF